VSATFLLVASPPFAVLLPPLPPCASPLEADASAQ